MAAASPELAPNPSEGVAPQDPAATPSIGPAPKKNTKRGVTSPKATSMVPSTNTNTNFNTIAVWSLLSADSFRQTLTATIVSAYLTPAEAKAPVHPMDAVVANKWNALTNRRDAFFGVRLAATQFKVEGKVVPVYDDEAKSRAVESLKKHSPLLGQTLNVTPSIPPGDAVWILLQRLWSSILGAATCMSADMYLQLSTTVYQHLIPGIGPEAALFLARTMASADCSSIKTAEPTITPEEFCRLMLDVANSWQESASPKETCAFLSSLAQVLVPPEEWAQMMTILQNNPAQAAQHSADLPTKNKRKWGAFSSFKSIAEKSNPINYQSFRLHEGEVPISVVAPTLATIQGKGPPSKIKCQGDKELLEHILHLPTSNSISLYAGYIQGNSAPVYLPTYHPTNTGSKGRLSPVPSTAMGSSIGFGSSMKSSHSRSRTRSPHAKRTLDYRGPEMASGKDPTILDLQGPAATIRRLPNAIKFSRKSLTPIGDSRQPSPTGTHITSIESPPLSPEETAKIQFFTKIAAELKETEERNPVRVREDYAPSSAIQPSPTKRQKKYGPPQKTHEPLGFSKRGLNTCFNPKDYRYRPATPTPAAEGSASWSAHGLADSSPMYVAYVQKTCTYNPLNAPSVPTPVRIDPSGKKNKLVRAIMKDGAKRETSITVWPTMDQPKHTQTSTERLQDTQTKMQNARKKSMKNRSMAERSYASPKPDPGDPLKYEKVWLKDAKNEENFYKRRQQREQSHKDFEFLQQAREVQRKEIQDKVALRKQQRQAQKASEMGYDYAVSGDYEAHSDPYVPQYVSQEHMNMYWESDVHDNLPSYASSGRPMYTAANSPSQTPPQPSTPVRDQNRPPWDGAEGYDPEDGYTEPQPTEREVFEISIDEHTNHDLPQMSIHPPEEEPNEQVVYGQQAVSYSSYPAEEESLGESQTRVDPEEYLQTSMTVLGEVGSIIETPKGELMSAMDLGMDLLDGIQELDQRRDEMEIRRSSLNSPPEDQAMTSIARRLTGKRDYYHKQQHPSYSTHTSQLQGTLRGAE